MKTTAVDKKTGVGFLRGITHTIKGFFTRIAEFFRNAGRETYASMCFMGAGQLVNGQIGRGIVYMLTEVAFIFYFSLTGVKNLLGFFTLGEVKADPWLGTEGDNSVIVLLLGILAWLALFAFIALYVANIIDAQRNGERKKMGKNTPLFIDDLSSLINKNFYKTALAIPLIGVCIFNILPIIFMILTAFTNYGGTVVPPELVDWVGLENFQKLLVLSDFGQTFTKILGWNILWALLSTCVNYFAGLGLALLYNKKCVKGKAIWRGFPVLAYAIPGFITLLAFKFMFSNGGPINDMIVANGGQIVDFFGLNNKWTSRLIGLFVNSWLSIPSIMLLATGILSNMNNDLYEAARIDGASSAVQFRKLTLPFVLFSTTPVLISQFVANFNNFGVFYFLRDGIISDGYFLASDTDLLINWLYRLSIDNNYYAIGATISLLIFVITSVISLVVYIRSASYKQEDTYR